MNDGRRTTNDERGFTLIEMLFVIVVMAILAGMLFPVILKSRSWAREKQAMMEIKNIEIAVKAYHAVYGKWPNQVQSERDVWYFLDNAVVIDALTSNNPRNQLFLSLQQSAISTNSDSRGSYLDPWGHPYLIILDDSCDNKIAVNAEGLTKTNILFPVIHPISLILTNFNGVVTTNTLQFIGDFNVGVASLGSGDTPVSVGQDTYLNMDLCSWRMGRKTK